MGAWQSLAVKLGEVIFYLIFFFYFEIPTPNVPQMKDVLLRMAINATW